MQHHSHVFMLHEMTVIHIITAITPGERKQAILPVHWTVSVRYRGGICRQSQQDSGILGQISHCCHHKKVKDLAAFWRFGRKIPRGKDQPRDEEN